ncbi:MAG: selenide, water dikinase SelD [Limnohabitans sp.]|nr:selenide, water dikinase SelD [Limnohabitans sp.]
MVNSTTPTYNGRLTSLSHGGGCGCKIAPGILSDILKDSPFKTISQSLLAGSENNEDAAVYQINDRQAIVATTDFFMPIVDDPFDFGRIAATNAISDVYAMGGQPLFALALLGMPIQVLPLETIQKITAGGESVCQSAGIPIAGGHSIDSVEPIYGLVVIGIVDPNNLKRNSGAQEGDCIIVSKPIGVGILSAGLKKERLSPSGYEQMIALTTQLNKPGVALAKMADVHALTDVTGFGLAGHLLEMARGANLRAELQWDQIPLVTEAVELAKADIYTGASTRNWQAYGHEINLSATMKEWQQHLITDPQTSGGLLISCAPQAEQAVIQLLQQAGFGEAKTIGRFVAGKGLGLV